MSLNPATGPSAMKEEELVQTLLGETFHFRVKNINKSSDLVI